MRTRDRTHDDDSTPNGGDGPDQGGNLGRIRGVADDLVNSSRSKIDNLLAGGQSSAFLADNRQHSAQ